MTDKVREIDPKLAARMQQREELLSNSDRFIADVGAMRVQPNPKKGKSNV